MKSSPTWFRFCHEASLLLTVLVTLGACGGGGGGGGATPGSNGGPEALLASQPGELVRYFQARLDQRKASDGAAVSAGSPAPALSASLVYSGTTVQELGVDEDDLLKTNGSLLVSLTRQWNEGSGANLLPPSRLNTWRRETSGQLTALGTLPLVGDAYYSGLYLSTNARRVAALGQRDWVGLPVAGGGPAGVALTVMPPVASKISLEIVDMANPAAPASTHQIEIDGRLVGSRLIGDRLYVVSSWSPPLAADRLPVGSEARKVATAKLQSADVLPTIRANKAAAQALLPDTDCYIQPANASLSLELSTITVFDLASPTLARTSRCFAGGSEAVYVAPTHAYLASTRYSYGPDGGRGIVYSAQASTDIHKFALADGGISYRGSGTVAGHLGWDAEKKPYRLSEHNGDLRVLSFAGDVGWAEPATTQVAPASPAALSVLRENSSERRLQVLATLPNSQRNTALGKPGEQIYAVRFAGPRAYLVTFRRTDPLYVLDLSSPTDPKPIGELQAPGYSDYLFLLDDGLLLGVGKDADATGRTGGVKVALLDVANPAAPRELATRLYGKAGSASALDTSRHGINLLRDGAVTRVALPVRIHDGMASGGWFEPTSQGLVRLEVNHTTRTLTDKPLLSSIFFTTEASRQQAYGRYDVGQERSVQIGAQVYYLSGGSVRGEAW